MSYEIKNKIYNTTRIKNTYRLIELTYRKGFYVKI
jgi:hypothetical protein